MRRKRDIHDPLRNPYVRPVLLTGCILLALWAVGETKWAHRELYFHMGLGHPLSDNVGLNLKVPGASYRQGGSYFRPLWLIDVRYSFVAFLLRCVAVTWLLARMLKIWRARRRRPGSCNNCGYDLRASQGRCPECGTPIPEEGANAAVVLARESASG